MKSVFHRFAQSISKGVGSPYAFAFAVACVVVWLVSGPIFNYSDTWQLVINTGTTVITFLIVFLIQNMQNRDSEALHLKIDELIRANSKARNMLLDLEDMSDEELKELHEEFIELQKTYANRAQKVKEHRTGRT